ncbi:hypothetical protein ACFYNM_15510 [Streptomyces spororaveus]|uniref:hypothetical protein n=1 Tax=Streptomyces spororaveus TaxID=284039 RepID=UPI00369FEE8F
MTPGVSEAGRLTPGGRGGRRPVGRDPSQPARLPVEPLWIRRITPWLLGVAVILPALSVATELAIRPDGDDLRRIAAIQKAGAETAEGTVVSVGRRTWDDPKVAMFSADVTVEVPVLALDGRRVTGRVAVRNGHFGMEGGSRCSSPRPTVVLYAPSAPELGGVVDYSGQVGWYAETDSPVAFSLPPHLTVAAFVPGGLLLYTWVLRVTWYAPKADAAARTLREDAAGPPRPPYSPTRTAVPSSPPPPPPCCRAPTGPGSAACCCPTPSPPTS